MEPDDGMEEEGPYLAWLPPDDRLWRHPSEGPAPDQPPAAEPGKDDRGRGGAGGAGGGGAGGGGAGGRDRAGRTSAGGEGGQGSGAQSLPSQLAGWGRRPSARILAIAVVAAIVGAFAATGVGMLTGAFEQHPVVVRSVAPTAPTVTLASATANGVDWADLDNAVAPSVAEVQVTTASGPATGSGLLFQQGDGNNIYVVTDSSLVAGASGISVSLVGGHQYRGRLVGSDPVSGLAVVTVAIPYLYQNLPEIGSVAEIHLADPVLAVGARANAPASVFSGSVSAEDREVDVTGGSTMENLIAVSGSSSLPSTEAGGPLIDQLGRVVGITVSLSPTNSSDQGLLYAVPVDVALHVTQQLLAGTKVTHPWVGIFDTDDAASTIANEYNVSGAAEVGQVSPGSSASRMGLQPDDVITALNGTLVTSSGTLTQILMTQGVPGRPLPIRYVHDGKWMQGALKVTEQPTGD